VGVLQGLTKEQQIQLAALMVDVASDLEKYRNRKQAQVWFRSLGREGPRRQRMLLRKVAKVRQALDDLHKYAESLDPSVGSEYQQAADAALAQLSVLGGARPFEPLLDLSAELRGIAGDPTSFSMVQLYWFFRHECGLSGDESEVRVAVLRNELWHEYGVDRVAYRPRYEDAESRGCQAVHEAVRRFRPRQGTSQ
jgi:hypothetical protein